MLLRQRSLPSRRSPDAASPTTTGRDSRGRRSCWSARGRSTRCWRHTDDAKLAERLKRAREIRAFASQELALPDNASYTRYTDVGRPFVVWNVFAAPALSLTPRQWCFPVAGCVSYRGYFNEAEARAEAARLAAEGDDVYIGGVPAYSTLGWFDDPVLSSFIRYPDTALARLVFHELAHQVVYAKDDTEFNESFATAVEEAGVARWIAKQSARPQHAALLAEQARGDACAPSSAGWSARRGRSSPPSTRAMRATPKSCAQKQAVLREMRESYEQAKAGEAGLARSTAGSPATRARASTTPA